ncbi:TonB-dependent receptor domain-containing protein [Paracandidimonas soli]|uniref:Iron complex outermembrane receptor protein n=1 Tax=Paracandidimonas soli TaxID=1917182 RepID=A0A4R3UY12_9BURK|nr:TonB-dependent receptor [Paracandidimonas soli]TCU96010.1 iron complex outermembrane receptor protein [Paracandidimonas soli]
MTFKPHPLAAAIALTLLQPAHAQSSAKPESNVRELAPIVVSANPLGRDTDSLATPVTVLESHDLTLRRRGTLGDLLDGLPGVHTDAFGGGASRPVIRGQTAPRVKVLSDGAEVADASTISPDHVVAVDTLLARRVEVLRGPSALLYGGDAIGGVVNVLDDKIPTAVPENGVSGSVEVLGSTAAKERAGAVGLTMGEGNIVMRVEGAKRRADNYRVPDWTESRVANSNAETSTGSFGLSFVGDRGYIGAAYSYREDVYGLPGHNHEYEDCHPHGSSLHCGGHDHDHDHDHDHGHDHDEHEEHAATAHLRSTRLDVRGELRDPFAGFEALRFRGGYTDYRHDERDDGVVGTAFRKHGYDGRLELQHQPLGGWKGVVGLQASRYDFASEGGSENFMPRTRTRNAGVFLLEEYQWNDVRFELGARHERQSVKPASGNRPDFSDGATSFSAGAVWSFAPAYAASLSLSRSQRMPTAQELYARGVHLATNTYEIGDADLGKETARTIDLGLRKTEGDFQFGVNLFHSRVNGYIYGATLDQHEDFRLIKYTQKDAQFTGLEAEATYRFTPNVSATVFGDYVRGKLRGDDGNLPRIPSARLGVRTNVNWQQWSGFVEYAHVYRQDKVAAQEHEQETPGYGMLGMGVAYNGSLGGTDYQLYLRGTNLLNKLAYNHASFISRLAPIQGRSVQAGVRVAF